MITIKLQKAYPLIIVAFLTIFLGIVLRLKQYLINRSLWFDEAMLALNIVNRSFSELTQPLSYYQGAPVGFLFLQKITIQMLGNHDYILRLLPLFTSIIALFLMYRVTRIYIGLVGLPIAVGLFAISTPLVHYASEMKQYSGDVMITLLLLLAASKCLRSNPTSKDFFVLTLIGVASMWLSHPATFVMSGIGVSIVLGSILDKKQQKLSWVGACLFFWLASFTLLYFFSLQSLSRNSVLLDYWQDSFMPLPPWQNINWFLSTFTDMLSNPVGLTNIFASAFLLLLGCLSLTIRNWRFAIVMILPFLSTLVASGLGKYPFSDRLLLFITPIVFLLVAEGVERIRLVLSKYNRMISTIAWSLLTLLLLYGPIGLAIQNFNYPFTHPASREHIKPVIQYLDQHRIKIDAIYVYYGAVPAFQYYASLYGFEESEYIIGKEARQDPQQYLEDINNTIDHQERVWFIFSHNCTWCIVNEENYFLQHLDSIGSRQSESKSFDTSGYLYEFN